MHREIHTPEGMRDVFGSECRRKKLLQSRIRTVFYKYGYEDIETPVIEYFDVFSNEVGTTPSRDLYKFFDRIGDTLVLRPDFTPSIARACAMYYSDALMPVRLCYQGKVFENKSSYQGRLNESTQLGVELIGDPSLSADAEMIALCIDVLKASGLSDFQISIGEMNYFKALVAEAGLTDTAEQELRARFSHKNNFGVDEILEREHVPDRLREVFRSFPGLFGGADMLAKARSITSNTKARSVIDRLEQLYDLLKVYKVDQYVSFDLSMLSKYRYYTGIIFQGFTYGIGEPLVKGGRYDRLLSHFGMDEAAIGFGLVMENLMNALLRQNIDIDSHSERLMIVYDPDQFETALRIAKEQRTRGIFVSLYMSKNGRSKADYEAFAASKNTRLMIL